MPAIELACWWCGAELRFAARSTTKYCGVNHRMQAYRERLRTKAANLERFTRHADLEHTDVGAHDVEIGHRYGDRDHAAQPQLEDDIDRWLRTPIVPKAGDG